MKYKILFVASALIVAAAVAFMVMSSNNGPSSVTIIVTGSGTAFAEFTENPQWGTHINLRAEPEYGYEFVEWQLLGGVAVLADVDSPSTYFVMPPNYVVLGAVFDVPRDPPEPPLFSHEAGFFPSEFELVITSEPGTIIRYTTDGSIPSIDSPVFTGYLLVHSPEPTLENSPLSARAVGRAYEHGSWHSDYVPNLYYNGMVVRARAFNENGRGSATVTRSFFVENGGRGNFSTRVVSITMEPGHFFHVTQGMYYNWDRESWPGQPDVDSDDGPRHISYVEIFYQDGSRLLSQYANVWVFGNWSRRHPKRSLRINFSQGDGDIVGVPSFMPDTRRHFYAPLEYIDTFRHLNARVTDRNRTGMRDSLVHLMAEPLRPTIQNTIYGAVFINGEFWGMYCLRTHRHERLLAQLYGVSPSSVQLEDWTEGFLYREYFQGRDMSSPTAFEELDRHIDMDNLIDYLIIGYHFDNWDWFSNNFEFWRTTEYYAGVHGGDMRWRFVVQDFDEGMNAPNNNMMDFFSTPRGQGINVQTWPWGFGTHQLRYPWVAGMFRGFFENEHLRNTFAARYSTYTGTVFHPSRANAVLDRMVAEREPHVGADLYRWSFHNAINPNVGVGGWIHGSGGVNTLRTILTRRANYSIYHILDYLNGAGRSTINLHLDDTGLTNVSFITDCGRGWFDIAGAQIRADLFERGNIEDYGFSIGDFNANYIRGLPFPVTAVPLTGNRFSHFVVTGGLQKTSYENPMLIKPPANCGLPIIVTAVWED